MGWLRLTGAIFLASFLRLDINGPCTPWRSLPDAARNFQKWDGQRPLNIVFMSWGSRGDHQPNVALGLELARRGHNVTVMGLAKYRDIIERHHPTILYALLEDDHIWKLAEQFGASEGVDFLELTRSYAVNSSRQLVSQYMEIGKDADVLVGNHAAMTILHHLTVAEALQKPLFLTTHDLTLPTAAYSFNLAESRVKDYGRRTNVFNHRIFSVVFGAALTWGNCEWRRLRQELGLATPWPFMELLSPQRLADFPIFYTADPTLWPPPLDQPPHWYSTGYFVTLDDQLESYPGSLELQTWIDHRKPLNRPLLYFGQGSFSHHDQVQFTDVLLDTCEQLELDAVVLETTVDERRPPFLKVVNETDQERLFPQCAVISHHGGAGTSSQCIRSGKPGLCMPAMPFQEIWGAQLEEFGAGVVLRPNEMLAAWRDNGTNLMMSAVQRAMTPSVQKKASKLGALARDGTGGVKLAANMILKHLEALRKQEASTSSQESEL